MRVQLESLRIRKEFFFPDSETTPQAVCVLDRIRSASHLQKSLGFSDLEMVEVALSLYGFENTLMW